MSPATAPCARAPGVAMRAPGSQCIFTVLAISAMRGPQNGWLAGWHPFLRIHACSPGLLACIQGCLHARNVWLPASHLRAGCGKHGQDSENGVAARRADGRLSRARARARPRGLLLTTPARARAWRSIFHRIWTPQCQNAVKKRRRTVVAAGRSAGGSVEGIRCT